MIIDELGNVYNVRRCTIEDGVWIEKWFAKPDHDDEITMLVKELTRDAMWSSLDECPDPDVMLFIPGDYADVVGHMLCAACVERERKAQP